MTNYTVDALVADPTNGTSGGVGVIGRAQGPNSYYLLEIRPAINGTTPYWFLYRDANSTWTVLGSGPVNAPDKNVNYDLQLSFSGSTIGAAVAFDGGTTFKKLTTVTDASYSSGQVGVRIWGLSDARLQTLAATQLPATLSPETAVSTTAFIDSLGMNAHFESPIYYDAPVHVSALVAGLGIKHYRVSAGNILFPNGGYKNTLAALYASSGLRYDVLSDLHTTPAQVVAAIRMLPVGSVDAVEGPNETDNPGQGSYYDPNFKTDIPVYMKDLYATLKANPATSNLTIIGPSFVNSSSYAAIGNISEYVNDGNMHDYLAGFSPGTNGWGGGGYAFAPNTTYGSIAWNLGSSSQATGTEPIDATETGYCTAPIHSCVPFEVQAKYVPRLFLEQYLHGVPHTYLYQLIGYDTTTQDGTLGIVSPSYVASPAYTAIAGLVSMLEDGTAIGSPAIGSPTTVSWQLSGQTANVAHLLMHKSDGTVVIPLWIEDPSFDPNAAGGIGSTLSVVQQTVTVNLATTASKGTLWTCNPATGQWSSSSVAFSNGAVSIPVTDTVSVLEVTS